MPVCSDGNGYWDTVADLSPSAEYAKRQLATIWEGEAVYASLESNFAKLQCNFSSLKVYCNGLRQEVLPPTPHNTHALVSAAVEALICGHCCPKPPVWRRYNESYAVIHVVGVD